MRSIAYKLSRYLIAGGFAAIVDAGGFGVLTHFGVVPAAAATISFIIAAVVNYQCSSRFVFHQQVSRSRFLRFLAFAVVGMLINVSITIAMIGMGIAPPILAKVFAIAITFVVNFLLNNYLVFKHDVH